MATDDRFSYSAKLAFLSRIARDRRLGQPCIAVASVLIDRANPDSLACYPSVAAIVQESGVPKSTALRALRQLEACGWIRANKRYGAHSTYDIQTGAAVGTGPARGTGATSNLKRGRTGSDHGTEAVPTTGPEQKEKKKKNRDGVALTFSDWSRQKRDNEEKLVPATDPIFEFRDNAGIPDDFFYLAWKAFVLRYRDSEETCFNWRARFGRAVREDWFKLWRVDRATSEYVLTTAGEQLQRALDAEEAMKEAA